MIYHRNETEIQSSKFSLDLPLLYHIFMDPRAPYSLKTNSIFFRFTSINFYKLPKSSGSFKIADKYY